MKNCTLRERRLGYWIFLEKWKKANNWAELSVTPQCSGILEEIKGLVKQWINIWACTD